jgi:hypothetical protein
VTKVIGSTIIIEPEPDGKCELCGKIDELRPYGPNKENICYECGMKNEDATDAAIQERFNEAKRGFEWIN